MNFLQIVLWAVGFVAGCFWAAFAIITPITSVRVGLPFCKASQKMYPKIDFSPVKKIYVFNIVLCIILDAVVFAALFMYVPKFYRIAALVGMALALLMGLKQTGRNENSIKVCIEKAYKVVPEKKQADYAEKIMAKLLASN